MKRFAFLLAVVVLFFGSNFSLFGQTQNIEEEEIIEVEMNCFDFDDIEIIIEDIEPIEEGEIEISCQGDWSVEAIEAPREEEQIFCIVEQSATFEGGMEYFYNVVNNQMRFSETMKEGRVFLQFVVNKEGKVSEIKVIKGLSEENDKEALRIMNLISEHYDWIPAKQRDKTVKVRMSIPIVFKKTKKVKSNVDRVYRR